MGLKSNTGQIVNFNKSILSKYKLTVKCGVLEPLNSRLATRMSFAFLTAMKPRKGSQKYRRGFWSETEFKS